MKIRSIIFLGLFALSVSAQPLEAIQEGQARLIKENQAIQEPYVFVLKNTAFIGLPNVFSPKVFFADGAILDTIPFAPAKSFLEIGSGTGYVAVWAAKLGIQRVVAIDVNPDAVKNTKINALLLDVADRVDVRLGDLFKPLRKGEKFDLIYFDCPFNRSEKKDVTSLERAVFDPQGKALEQFMKTGQQYLKPSGAMVINRSEVLSDMKSFFALAQKHHWKVEALTEPVADIKIRTYKLSRK
jgi:release factor glutamine methyltransferase